MSNVNPKLEKFVASDELIKELKEKDIHDARGILEVDKDFLMEIDGIGEKKADDLIASAEDAFSKEADNGNMTTEVIVDEPVEKSEVVDTKTSSQENTAQQLIAQGMQSGASIEVMERLFELQKDMRAEQAREEFVQAMANFQRDCPEIEKTKVVKNKDGSVRYKYAPIDEIIKQIKQALADNGLSYSWDVENKKEGDQIFIEVTCEITHKAGHSKTSQFKIPIYDSEYMNSPQRYASTQTYAKRYSLTNVLGLATGEEDTDANGVGSNREPRSPKSKIMFLLRLLGKDTTKLDRDAIEEEIKTKTKLDLKEENFDEIISRLEELVKEQQEYENSNV